MGENEAGGRADANGNGARRPVPRLDYPAETASKTPLEALSRRMGPDSGPDTSAPGTPLQRLFWFGLLWLSGVAAVFLLAAVIRAVIG